MGVAAALRSSYRGVQHAPVLVDVLAQAHLPLVQLARGGPVQFTRHPPKHSLLPAPQQLPRLLAVRHHARSGAVGIRLKVRLERQYALLAAAACCFCVGRRCAVLLGEVEAPEAGLGTGWGACGV